MNRGGMYILNIERAIFKDKEEAGVGLIIRVAQGLLIAVMSKRSLFMNPTKSRWLLLTADRVLSFANYQIYEGTYDLFASGKIINSIQLMPRYIWSVFSLPFGICVYNLLQTVFILSVCSVATVHICINKNFSPCKVVHVNSRYVFICHQNNVKTEYSWIDEL